VRVELTERCLWLAGFFFSFQFRILKCVCRQFNPPLSISPKGAADDVARPTPFLILSRANTKKQPLYI